MRKEKRNKKLFGTDFTSKTKTKKRTKKEKEKSKDKMNHQITKY